MILLSVQFYFFLSYRSCKLKHFQHLIFNKQHCKHKTLYVTDLLYWVQSANILAIYLHKCVHKYFTKEMSTCWPWNFGTSCQLDEWMYGYAYHMKR